MNEIYANLWVFRNAEGNRLVTEDNLPAGPQDLQDYAADLAEKARLEGLTYGLVEIRLCLDREAENLSALLLED